mmetsp:Transcript_22362/g.42659  ORF Transcript_22362/g.42659 Transcript_22362/m.42659 type:complete len:217 (+) Transcript_22362:114-764(+)
MSPKKKKGGKKKKKEKSFVPIITFDYQMPLVSELGMKEISYISLTIKMVELIHLSFDWEVVPTLVTLAGIKDSIRTRHGGTLMEIILYKELISESNLLPNDDALSLQDVGIQGGVYTGIPSDLPHVTLWYDTPPLEVDCPVLNDTPYEYQPKYLKPDFSPRKRAGEASSKPSTAASGTRPPASEASTTPIKTNFRALTKASASIQAGGAGTPGGTG